MRVLYDGQIYRIQAAGGINRYFERLISGLPSQLVPTVYGIDSREVNFPRHPRLRTNKLIPFLPGRFSALYSRSLSNLAGLPGWDIAHPTYYNLSDGFRFSDYRCPVVVTVYDMIHALNPDLMVDGNEVIARQREAIHAAGAVICISESTRNDVLRFYPEVRDRTTVIYLGTDIGELETEGSDSLLPSPYFLFVGSRSGYKNFERLLGSFAKVASSDPHVLLCAAGAGLTERERWLIFDLGLRSRVHLFEHPNDRTLATLYRHSIALVYPSRYEGFGIPPLEAMACGTVCVTAGTSSLPEVVGDAGIMLDPMASDAWSDAMLSLLGNPSLRDSLITKGKARAQTFRWEDTVRKTIDVYEAAIKGGPIA